MLLISNEEVQQVLDMRECIDALSALYDEVGAGAAVSFPRSDLHLPTPIAEGEPAPMAHYMKTMGGGSPNAEGVAVRLSSDIVRWREEGGRLRREKLPALPGGKWLGLLLLFSSNNGELLAILQDGFLSRMRVGATNGLAARALCRSDASTVGLIGSGWQAGAQLLALAEVRSIRHVRVFSPTRENREAFAREMSKTLGITVEPVADGKTAARGADILVTATNARRPFVPPEWIERGMHVSTLQRDELTLGSYRAIDHLVIHTHALEFNATSRVLADRYAADGFVVRDHPEPPDIDWDSLPSLEDIMAERVRGRETDGQITGFVNNIGLGAQFAAVGKRVYDLARAQGLGRELPVEWFLEDIHP